MPDQPAVDQPAEQMARFLAGAAHLNPQRDTAAWDNLDDAGRDHYREQARRITGPPAPDEQPYRDLLARLEHEHARSTQAATRSTVDECRIAHSGIASGLLLAAVHAVHIFEGAEARAAYVQALSAPDGARTTPDNPANPSLRDLYAAAIREAACPGGYGATEEECRRQRIQPEVWHWGVIADVSGTPEQFADAVMTVRDRRVEELTAEVERMKILVAASSEDGHAVRMAGQYAERAIANGQRADTAEATLAQVQRLYDTGPIGTCCSHLLRAALNPQESS